MVTLCPRLGLAGLLVIGITAALRAAGIQDRQMPRLASLNSRPSAPATRPDLQLGSARASLADPGPGLGCLCRWLLPRLRRQRGGVAEAGRGLERADLRDAALWGSKSEPAQLPFDVHQPRIERNLDRTLLVLHYTI